MCSSEVIAASSGVRSWRSSANEAGLPSHCIGRIEIYDEFSVVGLPADLPADVLGVLRNFTPFYAAFGVKEGDGMYLPPDERVKIW